MIHHSDSKTPADQTPPSQEDRDQSVEATSVLPTHPEDFLTRNGLNLTSFRRRKAEDGAVDLDRKIKKRHLNMIALGGSIGAGLFVGSGSALSKGVSWLLLVSVFVGSSCHGHNLHGLKQSTKHDIGSCLASH